MNNTIHLPIKRKWFDMILSGEKEEEYREIKRYWWKRLLTVPSATSIAHHLCLENDLSSFEGCGLAPKYGNSTTLTLTAGYGRDKPRMVVELKWITIKKPNPEWCPPDTTGQWFALKLGAVLETYNLTADEDFRCGTGLNRCNCKTPKECGYIEFYTELNSRMAGR